MIDDRKDLPPANSPNFLERVREVLSTYLGGRGDPLKRGVIVGDLTDSGIAALRPGYGTRGIGGASPIVGPGSEVEPAYTVDLTPPSTPTGFAVSAAISNIFIEHDGPTYTQGHGHSRTKVYGATWISGPLPVFNDAVVITEFTGSVTAHATNPATTWHLWIKWVSVDGVESTTPAGGINGLVTTTGQDVALLLEALTGEITASELHNDLGTRIDLIDAGSGVAGSVNARLLTEANARIDAVTGESNARAAAITTEVNDRNAAILVETNNRINAVTDEATSRVNAINVESRQRGDQVQATAEALLRNVLASNDAALLGAANLARAKSEITSDYQAGISAEAAQRTTLEAKLTTEKAVTLALISGESVARATAVSAEAAQRTLLAAQVLGADGTALTQGLIYTERMARTTEDLALAQQITLLSAGAGEQFDWQTIWYFDAGIESWTGNGTPTATSGWLRPADQASGAYVNSAAGVAADGAKYGQVRLRIRKTGSPTFAGWLYWQGTLDSTWDNSRRVALTEPTYDSNGIGLITANPAWGSITVNKVRIDLSSAQTATDCFEIDWVAVGRPSPGASSAQLYTEQVARAAVDTAIASDVTTLFAQVNHVTTGLPATVALLETEQLARADADTAEAAARVALAARVTIAEGNITTTASNFTTEQTTRATADTANATAITTLSSQVNDVDTGLPQTRADLITTQNTLATATAASAADIRALRVQSQQIDETALRNILTGHATRAEFVGTLALASQELHTEMVTGLSAEATARLALAATVTTNAATTAAAIVSEQTVRAAADSAEAIARAALAATVTTNAATTAAAIETEQAARADADSAEAALRIALDARVTTAEGTITTTASSLTIEQNTRSYADTTNANAITALSSQVNDVSTGLPQTRADLITVQSTLATATAASAADIRSLRVQSQRIDETTLRNVLTGHATREEFIGTLAIATQELHTEMVNGLSAEATARLALAAVVDVTVATLTSEQITRASQTEALAQDVTSLTAVVDENQADLVRLYYTKTDADSAIAYAGTQLRSSMESPEGSVGGLAADLVNNYYTKTTADSAIASAGTQLRSYSDIGVKSFNQATAPTKRGVDTTVVPNVDVALVAGDVWVDTDDNVRHRWDGSAWVVASDTSYTIAQISNLEQTKIGYCTLSGAATDHTTRATCEAAGGTWNVGLPLAQAVKQVSVSDGTTTAALEQRFTAQKTLDDIFKLQYSVKLDVGGKVAGFGLYNASGTPSVFAIRADRFYISPPASGAGDATDDIVPFIVQATDATASNGTPIPAGVYIDTGFIKNATITAAKIGSVAADSITAGYMSATMAMSSGSIYNGVDAFTLTTNPTTGITTAVWKGNTPGTEGFGNGFYMGMGGGVAQFFVGRATGTPNYMLWNGTSLVVRGTVYATAGELQGITIKDNSGNVIMSSGAATFSGEVTGDVTGTVSGAVASTLVSHAATALANANDALDDAADARAAADSANGKLENIASDNILSPSEKPSVVQNYTVITTEQAGIDAQATSFGITTTKTAYDDAVYALTTYLGTLTGWNTVPGSDVSIVGSTFRGKFADVYTTKQALLDAIAARAKVLADTAQTRADISVRTDARNELSGPGGIAAGTLTWDSAGTRLGGYGLGLTRHGIKAYNSAGDVTFSISGSTGDATFAGALSAATGSFKGSVNVGDFTGNAWPAAGGTGAHLSAEAFLLGNQNAGGGNPNGKYFRVNLPAGGEPAIYTNIPAYIEDAQISTAKIGDLQVGTLKIADNAVTIPVGTNGAGTMPTVYVTLPVAGKILVIAQATGHSADGELMSISVTPTCGGNSGVATQTISGGSSFPSTTTSMYVFDMAAGTHACSASVNQPPSGILTSGIDTTVIMATGFLK